MALLYFIALWQIFSVDFCRGQAYETKEIEIDAAQHDEQFFTFLSRPDIDAPKWNHKVYNQSALAPGHWFVGPYGIVEQTDNDKTYVGPGIYDSRNGELIWNGGSDLNNFNVFGLKVTEFEGEDMLTFLQPQENHGVIMDTHYNIRRHVRTGIWQRTHNMHDFQLVENGTRALYMTSEHTKASHAESLTIEYDGECNVQFSGFEERDVDTDEILFSWSPKGRIALNESYWYPVNHTSGKYDMDRMCARELDYLHANSIDKLPDGDYLMSARHGYAIYKISAEDGHIVWRLGGKKSDFRMLGDTHFTAQHDARCLSQNETHMVISMMDNAVGIYDGWVSNPNSRGLILSVNTEDMTAMEMVHYDHPYGIGGYAEGRGNLQILPNGNAFASWKDNCLHSEYTADGALIAEAEFPAGLKTYRSFKFPWNGHPIVKPNIYSHVVSDQNGQLSTVVHISWNGDTTAHMWNLYRTDADGESSELLNSTQRIGFETSIMYEGYIPYVYVDALNGAGEHLPRSISDDVRTIFERDTKGSVPDSTGRSKNFQTMFMYAVVAFPGGVIVGILLSYFLARIRNGGSILPYRCRRSFYAPLREAEDKTETPESDRLLFENGKKFYSD